MSHFPCPIIKKGIFFDGLKLPKSVCAKTAHSSHLSTLSFRLLSLSLKGAKSSLLVIVVKILFTCLHDYAMFCFWNSLNRCHSTSGCTSGGVGGSLREGRAPYPDMPHDRSLTFGYKGY